MGWIKPVPVVGPIEQVIFVEFPESKLEPGAVADEDLGILEFVGGAPLADSESDGAHGYAAVALEALLVFEEDTDYLRLVVFYVEGDDGSLGDLALDEGVEVGRDRVHEEPGDLEAEPYATVFAADLVYEYGVVRVVVDLVLGGHVQMELGVRVLGLLGVARRVAEDVLEAVVEGEDVDELLLDVLDVLFLDSLTRIYDLDLDEIFVFESGADFYFSLLGEFEGVIDEVEEDLFDELGVWFDFHLVDAVVDMGFEGDIFESELVFVEVAALFNDLTEVEFVEVFLEVSELDIAVVYKVIDCVLHKFAAFFGWEYGILNPVIFRILVKDNVF